MPEFNTIRINWNHYAKVLEAKTKAGVPVFTRVVKAAKNEKYFFCKDFKQGMIGCIQQCDECKKIATTSYLNTIIKVPHYSKGHKVALGFIFLTWLIDKILF